jgi:hypothetical protein
MQFLLRKKVKERDKLNIETQVFKGRNRKKVFWIFMAC